MCLKPIFDPYLCKFITWVVKSDSAINGSLGVYLPSLEKNALYVFKL